MEVRASYCGVGGVSRVSKPCKNIPTSQVLKLFSNLGCARDNVKSPIFDLFWGELVSAVIQMMASATSLGFNEKELPNKSAWL